MVCHFRVSCSEQAAVQSAAHLKVHGPKNGSWTGGGLYDKSIYIHIKRTSKLNQTTSLAHRHEGGRPPSNVVSPPRIVKLRTRLQRRGAGLWGGWQQHSRRYKRYSFAVEQGLVVMTQGGSRSAFYLDGDQQTKPRTNNLRFGIDYYIGSQLGLININ